MRWWRVRCCCRRRCCCHRRELTRTPENRGRGERGQSVWTVESSAYTPREERRRRRSFVVALLRCALPAVPARPSVRPPRALLSNTDRFEGLGDDGQWRRHESREDSWSVGGRELGFGSWTGIRGLMGCDVQWPWCVHCVALRCSAAPWVVEGGARGRGSGRGSWVQRIRLLLTTIFSRAAMVGDDLGARTGGLRRGFKADKRSRPVVCLRTFSSRRARIMPGAALGLVNVKSQGQRFRRGEMGVACVKLVRGDGEPARVRRRCDTSRFVPTFLPPGLAAPARRQPLISSPTLRPSASPVSPARQPCPSIARQNCHRQPPCSHLSAQPKSLPHQLHALRHQDGPVRTRQTE